MFKNDVPSVNPPSTTLISIPFNQLQQTEEKDCGLQQQSS